MNNFNNLKIAKFKINKINKVLDIIHWVVKNDIKREITNFLWKQEEIYCYLNLLLKIHYYIIYKLL